MKKSIKNIVIIAGASLALLAIVSLGLWWMLISVGKDVFGSNHPQYAEYARLFNSKCSATQRGYFSRSSGGLDLLPSYDEEYIFATLSNLNISKEEALRLFYNSREEWQKRSLKNQVGAWQSCPSETIEYFNFAISVLENG